MESIYQVHSTRIKDTLSTLRHITMQFQNHERQRTCSVSFQRVNNKDRGRSVVISILHKGPAITEAKHKRFTLHRMEQSGLRISNFWCLLRSWLPLHSSFSAEDKMNRWASPRLLSLFLAWPTTVLLRPLFFSYCTAISISWRHSLPLMALTYSILGNWRGLISANYLIHVKL
jgi:hypothetical protein